VRHRRIAQRFAPLVNALLNILQVFPKIGLARLQPFQLIFDPMPSGSPDRLCQALLRLPDLRIDPSLD
jgi:hypothetical protein